MGREIDLLVNYPKTKRDTKALQEIERVGRGKAGRILVETRNE